MADPWIADIAIDAVLARSLIESQFPALAPARVEAFSEGWDNAAFLVNDMIVFRFPRRKVAVPLLERESRLLPVIKDELPEAVPAAEWVGAATAAYPYPFAGYRLLPGKTADRANLDAAARAALAPYLGQFLATLHEIPTREMEALGAIGDDIGRLDFAKRGPRDLEKLTKFEAEGVLDAALAGKLRKIAEEWPSIVKCRRLSLVHGDLYSRHLLVDGGALSGVIDWGDMHLNDPGIDLSIAFLFFPPVARAAFLAAYGRMPDGQLRLARYRAVSHSLAVLPYAIQTKDADLERETRRALAWAASEHS